VWPFVSVQPFPGTTARPKQSAAGSNEIDDGCGELISFAEMMDAHTTPRPSVAFAAVESPGSQTLEVDLKGSVVKAEELLDGVSELRECCLQY
jgi:hypothetical protein